MDAAPAAPAPAADAAIAPAPAADAAIAAPSQEELLAQANRGAASPFVLPRTFEGRPLAEADGFPNPALFLAGSVYIVAARFDGDVAAFRVGAVDDPGAAGWVAEVPGGALGLAHQELVEALRNGDEEYGASLVADWDRVRARAPGGFTLFVGARPADPAARSGFARVDARVELAPAAPERLAVCAWLLLATR
jgi:hypothetical protein